MDSKKWIGFQILRKIKKRMAKRHADSDLDEISTVEYDFITIRNATNNFSESNKIGRGGFGIVYKGTLEDGQQIAVKKLSKNLMECNLEFKNEVALMAKFQHRNLVRLLGFCHVGEEIILVYEFVPIGSLDDILFSPVKHEWLDWERRYKIIESITRGLIYLHEDSRLRIIHCNIKASNVLLDADLNAKIGDFDMARLFSFDKTHGSTSRIIGTYGYMAPEYVLQGEISVKSDVYCFGVLVLEIISGEKITSFQNEESMKDLLSYVWTHWKGGPASNRIDPMLMRGTSSPVNEITKCIDIALLCVQENVADRPTMVEVLQMLSNLSVSLPVSLAPGFFIHGSISSEASSRFTKNEISISDQYHRKMQKRKAKSYAKTVEESRSSVEISPVESHMKYKLITLQNATNNFSESNKIGQGGFGQVFKEGIEILLVYEFVPNGKIAHILFDPVKCGCLDWEGRFEILKRIAKGLVYLDKDSCLRYIHHNLKASNLLLDVDLNPKIADFGMARLLTFHETEGSTSRISETYGYIAPEYVWFGQFSVKSNVYSFGVLVLEIISGQRNNNFRSKGSIDGLPSYAWINWKNGSSSDVIDTMLRGISSHHVTDIIKCIQVALLCVQGNVEDRPTMGEVVQMLSNLSMSLPVPLVPGFFFNGSVSSDSSSRFTKNEMSISDQYHRKTQKRKAKSYVKTVEESSSSVEISPLETHLKLITIQNATDNFSEANKLGEGGYGPVYKGKLENGQLVAVKRLSENSWQGNLQFKTEVALLAKLQHRNLVRLLGYCQEGREMSLVYEFVPNGSLDQFLFDPIKCGYLDWGRRYKIIESIIRGLVYLHEDSRLRIVHRDVKASNILLDADLNPKICDFGLALLFALDETQLEAQAAGTLGYIAPEVYLRGKCSVKSDVYSFGVLLLEIISGHKCTIENEESIKHLPSYQNGEYATCLQSYAWTHWKNGSCLNVMDPMLRGVSSPVDDIIKCIHIALLCVQVNDEDRPSMGEVLQMLCNLSMSLPEPSDPVLINEMRPSFHSRFNSEASSNGMSVSDDDEYLR